MTDKGRRRRHGSGGKGARSLLGEVQAARALARTPGWRREGAELVRTYGFGDFREAMLFVNAVAALAERRAHHPDVIIRYREVTLRLWTHSAGGLTALDFDLARAIDAWCAPAA